MKAPVNITHGLVNHYFHSVEPDGEIQWQGQVIANPEPGWYLVQLFEWVAGTPNVQRLVPISEMQEWLFYGCWASFGMAFIRRLSEVS